VGGNTCPALCPTENIPLQEVVIEPVALAANAGDFPLRGRETGLWIATRGDSLDVRAVVRFDTVTSTITVDGETRPITSVDSAHIQIRFSLVDIGWSGDITLEAYDVDSVGVDTTTTALASLYRPDRLLGTVVVNSAALFLDDSVKIALPNALLLQKIRAGRPVRIGLRLGGAGHALLQSVETGAPARLSFKANPESRPINIAPVSRAPTSDATLATDLADYLVVVKGTDPVDGTRLVVGGLPSRRGYMRMVIPPFYFDSVVLVRATLSLTQRPTGTVFREQDIAVAPVAVSAGPLIVDIRRAASLVYPSLQFGIGAIVAAPADSGVRTIDLIQLVRQWGSVTDRATGPQNAIVLQSLSEGAGAGALEFFGPDAPAALRPKLRLSFIPRARFGRP